MGLAAAWPATTGRRCVVVEQANAGGSGAATAPGRAGR
jgi:hypothetical protein